ncbi:hypothetical protein IWQ51_001756 [Labrenzia sp. EL_142]|nr:hypothetical protein [Labrenzia sp. EL_142]
MFLSEFGSAEARKPIDTLRYTFPLVDRQGWKGIIRERIFYPAEVNEYSNCLVKTSCIHWRHEEELLEVAFTEMATDTKREGRLPFFLTDLKHNAF